jgi:hypothetical protein
VFFWYIGLSVVAVHQVFRSRGLDYRVVALGSILPLALDAPFGRFAYFHSLLFAVALLAVVMVATIGRPRLLRRRLICLPIGVFAGLVLSGAFLHDVSFLWPVEGSDFPKGSLLPPFALTVLFEAAGLAVIGWTASRFGLSDPSRRRALLHDGRLDEVRA